MNNRITRCAMAMLCLCMPPAAVLAAEISIIPRPVKMEIGEGTFIVKPATRVLTDAASDDAAGMARVLADMLNRATGYQIGVSSGGGSEAVADAIVLTRRNANAALGNEGYELAVTPRSVVIRAPNAAGLFYGVQSLRQLLPPQIETRSPAAPKIECAIPCLRIEDQPRFEWRGLLVDTARHFFPKDDLKRCVDLMALYKFNILQIHFTDDQSWALQIDAYPNLAKVGAFGGPYAINGTWLGVGKGIGSSRVHSKDDIRELVQYAAERRVTIVPEIEMPAHAGSWLAAYPDLLCTTHSKLPAPAMGTHGDDKTQAVWAAYRELCPGNDATYAMAKSILAEVAQMFPGPYLHVGGDEASKLGWKQCDRCQARMKAEGLKDERELQSYFIKRVGKFIQSKGRKFVGWDEIMQGGLAENAVVMSWTGVAPGQAAVKAGHDVVFSPTSHCYFDYTYQQIPTEKVYSFEPLEGLAAEHVRHVKGVQGNLWSEYIPDLKRLEYMAFPRACALAEVAWSPRESRNWPEFQKRLAAQLARLDALAVNYMR